MGAGADVEDDPYGLGGGSRGGDPRGEPFTEQAPQPPASCVELCPICRGADLLRGAGPPELRGQIDDVSREALLTLRALVDHYLERIDRPHAAADRVEEIPID